MRTTRPRNEPEHGTPPPPSRNGGARRAADLESEPEPEGPSEPEAHTGPDSDSRTSPTTHLLARLRGALKRAAEVEDIP